MSKYDAVKQIAMSQNGVRADLGNREDSYGRINGYWAGVPWFTFKPGLNYCAAFVSWVYQQAGHPLSDNGRVGFASTNDMLRWARQNGWARTARSADWSKPQIVLTKEPGSSAEVSHVGIGIGVEGDTILLVEGNFGGSEGNGVYLTRRYTLDNPRVVAVFDPIVAEQQFDQFNQQEPTYQTGAPQNPQGGFFDDIPSWVFYTTLAAGAVGVGFLFYKATRN